MDWRLKGQGLTSFKYPISPLLSFKVETPKKLYKNREHVTLFHKMDTTSMHVEVRL